MITAQPAEMRHRGGWDIRLGDDLDIAGAGRHVGRMADELSLAVVGIFYANADKQQSSRLFEIMVCKPGDPVDLRPEPKNEHDEHAVAVFSERGIQLGYLSAERAPFISRRIQRERSVAIFQGLADQAAYVRVRFGGERPTLPSTPIPPRSAAQLQPRHRPEINDDGFYPDPDGPDWGA